MAVKSKKILLGVSYVDKKGKVVPPGKIISLPTKDADKMIDAGQAVDPSEVVDIQSLESEAIKVVNAKVDELQTSLKETNADKAKAEQRAEQAELGIKALSDSVLAINLEGNDLKSKLLSIQEELKVAMNG